jgi:hypothetical protein
MENKATTKTPIPTTSRFRNFALCTCLHPDPLGLVFAFSTYLSCHEFIATETPFLPMDYFSVFSPFSVAISFVPPWLCGRESIMQNKPNFHSDKTNATPFAAKGYQRKPPLAGRRKQSQSNPIEPNFKMGKMKISTARTKAYAKEQRTTTNERHPKQTQSNPIQARNSSSARP